MRFVADLSDWDKSLNNLTIGESGEILSSHYKDQWDAYYAGRSFPMQFQKIDAKDTLVVSAAVRSDYRAIHKLLGPRGYLHKPEDLKLYEYDGGVDKARPDLVVFPRSTEDVVAIVKLAREHHMPIVGRGAGTGLSGGVIPRAGGIVVSFARMNRILEIDLANERAVLEPGVVNLEITQAVQAQGYFFAPDPSSQRACTIGGNVAENSGGPHTLCYGVTTNHVLGLEAVLAGRHRSFIPEDDARCARLRSDRAADRLRRNHGAGDEDHRAADAPAGDGEDHSGGLRSGRTIAPIRWRRSRRAPLRRLPSKCWMA